MQQDIAHILCEYFGTQEGKVCPHDLGGEHVKDTLNAMFRQLVIYADEVRRSDEDFEGCLSEDVNHTLSAFSTFVTDLSGFINELCSIRHMEAAVAIDPRQHLEMEQTNGLGFRPIPLPTSDCRFVINRSQADLEIGFSGDSTNKAA